MSEATSDLILGRSCFFASDLPDGPFFEFAVQPLLQKYFAFSETKISCSVHAVPPRQEGRTRRHERGVGCGGRGCDARRAALEADGEVVWSWRSEAGAKAAESFADDGGNQAMVTGESTK